MHRLMFGGVASAFAGTTAIIVIARLFKLSESFGLLLLPWLVALLISIRWAYRQGVHDGRRDTDRPM
jgi:hypothetical protein